MPPSPFSEAELQELIAKAQDGDTAAFEQLYEHFFAQVYRYASFRLEKEIAEDTVSDIFVKVWEKLSTYRQKSGIPFAAWLFRIARHCVIDAYRSHKPHEEIPETFADPDHLNRADSKMRRDDLLRTVRAAMDKLPRRYREVLLLTFVGELPNSEAARVLKMTEGGVRILKMRALRKLEQFLPPDSENFA